jgi:hypothetical protein
VESYGVPMSVTRPRGPLPARVYWVRRLLVLGVVFGLVFGISRLFGGGDASSEPAARPASATQSGGSTPSAVSTADARPGGSPSAGPSPQRTKTKTPLAMPTGPCRDNDVRVVPDLQATPYAGGKVRLTLRLSTFVSAACTWTVSPETVAVRLTSGSDRIWSSQDCPKAVPEEQVVLRDSQATYVDVSWGGRRSDSDCSRNTQWAEPGYYHLAAAAMGSEPESQQFELLRPVVTVAPSPTPRPKDKKKQGGERRDRQDGEPGRQDGSGGQDGSG